MTEISLEEAKIIQMQILDAVDSFCEKNKLTYYLSYGTLLGAIRHKGFIPWDDDIDIAMPYPDYIKFCNSFKAEQYKVNHWSTDRKFYCNFAKVEDTRTILLEKITSSFQIGINIDVAPIIGLPSNLNEAKKFYGKIVFYRNCLSLKKTQFRKGRQIHKQLFLLLARSLLCCIPYSTINKKIDFMCKQYLYSNSKYVICVGSFNPVKEIIEKNKLGKTIKVQFENKKYCVPAGYDAWLKQIFGDYMKLPPIEKRVSHHDFEMFWR